MSESKVKLAEKTQSNKTPKKRLAVFLDGTWNEIGDNTNVWRMRSLCSECSDDGCQQMSYYDIGVHGFWGGLFGKGLGKNIIEAYQWLMQHYEDGDEIFIFGFSRGAYTARSLAGFIAKCGLLKRGSPLGVGQLYDRYRRHWERTVWKLVEDFENGELGECSLEEQWMMCHSYRVEIKMVGVWDTVGALGVPAFSIPGVSRKTFNFYHTGLRLSIKHGFHAISIDEHRKSFEPTLWTVLVPKDKSIPHAPPRSLESVEQRWFVGAHSNVGGGYHSDLLAQIPLKWMMQKAAKLGLKFKSDIIVSGSAHQAKIHDSFIKFMWGIYRFISNRNFREIGRKAKPKGENIEMSVNETIDASVFKRWNTDDSYYPPKLAKWAREYNLNLSEMKSSVLAHDPKVSVE